MVSEADYLDSKQFPLSTQKGLKLQDQKLIDAINRDDLDRLVEEGKTLTEEQELLLAEFKLKQGR